MHVFWVDDLIAIQVEAHTHDFCQLIFCKKRGGKILIGETSYEARDGYVYLAPPFTTHAINNFGTMEILEVKFIADENMLREISKIPYVFNLKNIPYAEELLRLTVKEGMANARFCEKAVNYSFRLFFINVFRALSETSSKNDKRGIFRISDSAIESKDMQILNLRYYIEDHLSENITLDTLADRVHFNKSYFVKRFKLLLGETPIKYLNNIRIERSKQLLVQTEFSISEIAYKTGFPSTHYFSRLFRRSEGITPTEYRKRNSN